MPVCIHIYTHVYKHVSKSLHLLIVYDWFAGEEFDDVDDKATYQSMLTRDERRFKNADRDGDGIATREEFTAFLHPEEFDYMKDVVVQVQFSHQNETTNGKKSNYLALLQSFMLLHLRFLSHLFKKQTNNFLVTTVIIYLHLLEPGK